MNLSSPLSCANSALPTALELMNASTNVTHITRILHTCTLSLIVHRRNGWEGVSDIMLVPDMRSSNLHWTDVSFIFLNLYMKTFYLSTFFKIV